MYNPNTNIYIPTSTMIYRITLLLIMFAFLSACSGGGDGVKVTTYPKISLSVSNTSVAEGSGASNVTLVTLTAKASKIADENITVSLSTSGSATKNKDYSIEGDLSITIPAGATSAIKDFNFTIINDLIYEGDETVTINISAVSGGGATENGIQSVSIIIIDNELVPEVSLSSSKSSVSESDTNLTITITATSTQISQKDITVSLSTSGSATKNKDYSIEGDLSITIPAGSTIATIEFTIIDDSIYEGDETVTINISAVSGGGTTENGTQSVSITIHDNELVPEVSLLSSESSESSVYESDTNLTITATSTQISQKNITVSLSTSGSATEGEDYNTLPDIIILAGHTQGTTIFNPIEDTLNEGDEDAIISISKASSVLNSNANLPIDSTPITITIHEYALRTGTAFTEGTAAEINTIKNATNWKRIEASDRIRWAEEHDYITRHPYEILNIHKVQSFSYNGNYLTGIGQVIHIADFNCDDRHEIYNNKTIYNLDNGGEGESTFGSATADDYHCQFVAGIAAGDSNSEIVGVAPDADLVLSSIPNTNPPYQSDDLARDLDAAREHGAVASNNSWSTVNVSEGGEYDEDYEWQWNDTMLNVTEAQDYIKLDTNNGYTLNQILTGLMEEGELINEDNNRTEAWRSYITALDNFQESGVVVFANGNDFAESDASFMAGLPEFYTELEEAWLSVIYASGYLDNNNNIAMILEGNKCGSTKEYCLTVDDDGLYGASYVNDDGVSQYTDNVGGSSLGAPMVSGGIALLSQAFPNHTPEQLTDRVLASANNTWFEIENEGDYTTFTTHGNGIRHGYSDIYGHGIPDFYAALSPIISDSNINASMSLYMGDSIQKSFNSGASASFASSSITTSASFGDAIYQGLSGEVGYAYDDLNGGFEYDMSTRINMSNNNAPKIAPSFELSKLNSPLNSANLAWKDDFSQVISKLSTTDTLETVLTVGASSLPVQSFFGSNFDSSVNLDDYETPYLESGEGGVGLSATYQLDNSRLLVGITNPINQSNDNVIGLRKSLVASLEYGNPSDTAMTFMAGVTQDNDSLLGSTGNNAYSLSGASSNTTFTAFKAQTKFDKGLSLTTIVTLANTNMTRPNNSFINSASNVKSNSATLIANKSNLFGDDNVSFFVGQPNRVSDGSMSMKLSNLADYDGSLTYSNKSINLEPTARQLDYGFSYRKNLDEDISFSIKHIITDNLNHKQDSTKVSSSFIGVKHQDLEVGLAINVGADFNSQELYYSMQF